MEPWNLNSTEKLAQASTALVQPDLAFAITEGGLVIFIRRIDYYFRTRGTLTLSLFGFCRYSFELSA